MKKTHSKSEFVKKIKSLADAIAKEENYFIQIAHDRIIFPRQIEQEREEK